MKKVVLFSCYLSPNETLEVLEQGLETLGDLKRRTGKGIIGAGDINAWATEWGMKRVNERGRLVRKWIAQRNLLVGNVRNVHTFVRGEYGFIPDVTLASEETLEGISQWRVAEEIELLSDHRYIEYKVGGHEVREKRRKGWKIRLINKLRQPIRDAETLARTVIKASDTVMPRKGKLHGRKEVYWRSREISMLRNLRKPRSEEEAKKSDKGRKKGKMENVYQEVDGDVWGNGHKIVKRNLEEPQVMSAEIVVPLQSDCDGSVPRKRRDTLGRDGCGIGNLFLYRQGSPQDQTS